MKVVGGWKSNRIWNVLLGFLHIIKTLSHKNLRSETK